jgi:hypothetical protein
MSGAALRLTLALTLGTLSPAVAAAQAVSVAAEARAIVPAIPAFSVAPVLGAPTLAAPSAALALAAPTVSLSAPGAFAARAAAAAPAAVAAPAVAAPAAAVAVPAVAAAADAPQSAPAAAAAAPSAAESLAAAPARALSAAAFNAAEPAFARRTSSAARSSALWKRFFDGLGARRSADADAAPAVVPDARAAIPRSELFAPTRRLASVAPFIAAPRAPVRRGSAFGRAALVAAFVLLALPSFAFAATGAPTFTAAASVSLLAGVQPLASALGAVGGAIYGLIAARPKDGSAPSAGDTFSSMLHYGVLGGAGAYVLLDLTQLAFGAATALGGLRPLSSAVTTAALGRTAFQGKFADPATSSADRIVGAFPAVAAAVGLSIGIMTALSTAVSLSTVALGAMATTGVVGALYAAIFVPGRSPADGPARMAKGYVLQALMSGLAIALTNPWLVWPFAALGAAGFALVLWTIGRELLSRLPASASTPPAPPAKP